MNRTAGRILARTIDRLHRRPRRDRTRRSTTVPTVAGTVTVTLLPMPTRRTRTLSMPLSRHHTTMARPLLYPLLHPLRRIRRTSGAVTVQDAGVRTACDRTSNHISLVAWAAWAAWDRPTVHHRPSWARIIVSSHRPHHHHFAPTTLDSLLRKLHVSTPKAG